MSVFVQGEKLARTVRSADGLLQTQQLLEACRQVLPIVEKLGTGFGLVRVDVGGNIDRLAVRAAAAPAKYDPDVFQIVRDEMAAGTTSDSTSCAKGLLWLKRAMEFIVALLSRLHTDRDVTLSQAASDTYYATLQQYHGWIVTGTFTVALKLVPSREAFFVKAGGGGAGEAAVHVELAAFCEAFGAVLAEVHEFLEASGLDDPAKV